MLVMINVFGNEEYLLRFLNWNAVILQERTKVETAWVISTKEHGTGKGFNFR